MRRDSSHLRSDTRVVDRLGDSETGRGSFGKYGEAKVRALLAWRWEEKRGVQCNECVRLVSGQRGGIAVWAVCNALLQTLAACVANAARLLVSSS